jgi:NAD(P)-dependent dehydrogenase (short-subunit alcohol dehydrogenase family)
VIFERRIAIVTGGASGIGRATVEAFISLGACVAIFDTDEARGNEFAGFMTKRGGTCLFLPADVSNVRQVEAAFKTTLREFNRVDFLFNNAGADLVAPLLETSEQDWDRVLNTNLKGAFALSKLAVATMLGTGGGVIINNAADKAMHGSKLSTAYSASKAAMIQLTRSIALDYGASGIRSNCICPGCIRTPSLDKYNSSLAAKLGKTGEQVLQEFVEQTVPMRRAGTPEDVASVVIFLCSDQARYVNGAVIAIDGGLTAGI